MLAASLLKVGLDPQEKDQLVNLHNKLRARVALGEESRGLTGPQPPAADMMELIWDDELAAVAQRWAEQCNFGHDENRDVARFKVGQNVYETSRSRDQNLDITIREGIMGWYDEVKDFDQRGVDTYVFSSGVGHYTQMVWSQTTRVGCGHVSYPSGPWIKKLIVCNYGQTGNFIGSPHVRQGQGLFQVSKWYYLLSYQYWTVLCWKQHYTFIPNTSSSQQQQHTSKKTHNHWIPAYATYTSATSKTPTAPSTTPTDSCLRRHPRRY